MDSKCTVLVELQYQAGIIFKFVQCNIKNPALQKHNARLKQLTTREIMKTWERGVKNGFNFTFDISI